MKRIKQEQHIEIQEKSQQLKFRMQTEIQIDKHHALCQASGQLEELDYTKLHFAYSGIRKSQIEPRVLFKVLVCFQYFDRLTLVFHIFVPREQEKGLLHWLLSPSLPVGTGGISGITLYFQKCSSLAMRLFRTSLSVVIL